MRITELIDELYTEINEDFMADELSERDVALITTYLDQIYEQAQLNESRTLR